MGRLEEIEKSHTKFQNWFKKTCPGNKKPDDTLWLISRVRELERLHIPGEDKEDFYNVLRALRTENQRLESKLTITSKALEFYGDEKNWLWEYGDSNKTECVMTKDDVEFSDDFRDGLAGKTAREALKDIEGD